MHDFAYFLIISGLLTCFQLQQDKRYLAFTCSKSTIKTLEQDMKHAYSWNLKINKPEQHYLILVFLLLTLNIWVTDGMLHVHLTITMQVTINISVAFQSISKRTKNQFREFLRKMLPWNLAPVNNQILP